MKEPPTQFLTERLRLRVPAVRDAASIFASYATDPEVTRYLVWRPHLDVSQTRDFMAWCIDEWRRRASFPYVIEIAAEPGSPIGMIHVRPSPHGTGFGYVLARAHWSKGYTTEALKRLVDWQLSEGGVFRCFALCDVDNTASARVMEKAGMSFEGVVRRSLVHPNVSDEPRDARLYAKVR